MKSDRNRTHIHFGKRIKTDCHSKAKEKKKEEKFHEIFIKITVFCPEIYEICQSVVFIENKYLKM